MVLKVHPHSIDPCPHAHTLYKHLISVLQSENSSSLVGPGKEEVVESSPDTTQMEQSSGAGSKPYPHHGMTSMGKE